MKNDTCGTLSTASKGHFVLYSVDGRRFEIPLTVLRNPIVAELLQAAEEEFGLARKGPITLPCDGILMEYVLSLIGRSMSEDLQKQLYASIARNSCFSYSVLYFTRNKFLYPVSCTSPCMKFCTSQLVVTFVFDFVQRK
ncbi:hypothetical protein Droror1_Dr00028021 [Drosera rotundifolia]